MLLPKSTKKVLSRRRNGDIGYENDGKEHEETDETGDNGEDEDEDEEVEYATTTTAAYKVSMSLKRQLTHILFSD